MESYVLARRKCKALSELWWVAIHRGPPHEGEKGKAVWTATERQWSQGASTNDCNTWNQVVNYICFFSFSISLFTNDLCFNIWHSKTSAMPSYGGISLLCWELKFHFWNFSSDIVLRHCFVFEGLLCPSVRREENYQAKACSFSFAKSRVRWQSDWGNAWMWSKRARNMKWDHDVYCRLQVPDKSRQDQLQELRNEVHHPSPNWDIITLRDYGNNRSSKVWVPGGFWILEGGDSGNHIVHFYTAVLDVIKMGLQVVAW